MGKSGWKDRKKSTLRERMKEKKETKNEEGKMRGEKKKAH